ncbi:MAG: hypothetical protein E7551_05055 [Ruminococcaceae bacterium]|nr:hypothetical protein [Oscillospiraceae bacterium]
MSNIKYPILEGQGNKKIIKVNLREYIFENSCFPTSVKSMGQEILNGPIRVVCKANQNNQVFEPADLCVTSYKEDAINLTATMQSEVFFINTNTSIEEDGASFVDMSIMPRGLTVPQMFGLEPRVFHRRVIDNLWLEIPIKKECATYYSLPCQTRVYGDVEYCDLEKGEPWQLSWSGLVPEKGFSCEFTSQILLANDDVGFGLFFYSDEHWNIKNKRKAFEVEVTEDECILRIHLLDGEPDVWRGHTTDDGSMWLHPINFRFGFSATPYHELAPAPFTEKALHIDCFKKVLNNYEDFLSAPVVEGDTEIGFDRIKRLGVEVLYIHEKWNDIQNSPILTDRTKERAKYIIEECHKRGIKVIPYYGFEISSLSPYFGKYGHKWKWIPDAKSPNKLNHWNRWPGQRALRVCMDSDWADVFVDGVIRVIEEFGFDGIYLDGTIMPAACANVEHGCGYTDMNGEIHPTYSQDGTRRILKGIYKYIKEHNLIMNCHCNATMNLAAINYCTSVWEGETFQSLLLHGKVTKMPGGHLRTIFGSKHFGVPVYSLCYSNDPIWTYHNAIATQLLHNSMPKPVDIGAPLEETSRVWKAYDAFPIAKSQWKPYYTENGVTTSDERVKVSYYDAGDKIMAVVAGTEKGIESDVTVDFGALGATNLTDAFTGEKIADGSKYTARVEGFEYKLILADK